LSGAGASLKLDAAPSFGADICWTRPACGNTELIESLALWALARLLPVYSGEGCDLARSLRRRFAMVGLLFASALVGTLWEWTANVAVTGAASIMIVAGLWLYSEHGNRPAA
jgi:hypothetical protein